ncbi:MAG: ATP synthase F0 subunit B [Acutalibacteraceae bacterium]|nr:ATP synthase F0 subunit B [Acutalibacteraceae bacterium]
MPLNIDWQQILLHLFNFAILAVGLYMLLYKPVKNFMDKRTDYYRELDNQAKQTLKEAEKEKESYEQRLSNVESEISEKRAKAAKEAEQIAAMQIQSAKDEAKQIVEKAKEVAENEHSRIIKDAQVEITKLAIAATEKLVAQSSDTLDQFISVTERGDKDD